MRHDLATANPESDEVSILLGEGDGKFQPADQIVAGYQADAIVAGDFNGDGRLDLAVAALRRRERWRSCWATGTASSSPPTTTPSGIDPTRHRGRRFQRGRPARPGRIANADSSAPSPSCGRNGTFQPPDVRRASGTFGVGEARPPSWPAISAATVGSTWPSETPG